MSPLPTMPGFALSAGLQAPVELKAVAEAQVAAELLKEREWGGWDGMGWDGDFWDDFLDDVGMLSLG